MTEYTPEFFDIPSERLFQIFVPTGHEFKIGDMFDDNHQIVGLSSNDNKTKIILMRAENG